MSDPGKRTVVVMSVGCIPEEHVTFLEELCKLIGIKGDGVVFVNIMDSDAEKQAILDQKIENGLQGNSTQSEEDYFPFETPSD